MSENEIQEIYEKLLKNPEFGDSLSDKELFHSNKLKFWALNYPNFFNAIIQKLIDVEDFDVKNYNALREDKNIDFKLKTKDGKSDFFILENKMKSVPYAYQLEKYANESTLGCKKILLTMMPPIESIGKSNNESDWKVVLYKEFLQILKDCKSNITDKKYLCRLEDYINLLDLLIQLVEYYQNVGNNYALSCEDLEKIKKQAEKYGLRDLCSKVLVSTLIPELQKRIGVKVYGKVDHKENWNEALIYMDYSQNEALIDIQKPVRVENSITYVAGIEYQGNTLKFFVKDYSEKVDSALPYFKDYLENGHGKTQKNKKGELYGYKTGMRYTKKELTNESIKDILSIIERTYKILKEEKYVLPKL